MRAVAIAALASLYVLHQDLWFWREARPLVFGFLPIGLFYHAAFTVATTGALWLLVKLAWPSHLEPRRHEDTNHEDTNTRRREGTNQEGTKAREREDMKGDAARAPQAERVTPPRDR